MSTIRRQSIISSLVVYVGFAIGFFNTYLFTRQGGFRKEEFGLTAIFVSVGQLMFALAGMGMQSYITKFFPYYKAHVPARKNDQLTWALLFPTLAFSLVVVLGLLFKGPLIDKIFNNSPELLKYYGWLFPFGFGFTLFMVLDMYAWQLNKAVLSNVLREVMFRAFVTVLIVLATFHVIQQFNTFIGLYSFVYVFLMLVLLVYLKSTGRIHFSFQPSIVTRKFRKKILTLLGFVWSGGLIFNLAQVVDTIFIAAVIPDGVGAAGVFTFGQYMTSLIQAPQRAVVSSAMGPISQAWRDKDYGRIQRIYYRSSVNQLLFACAMFSLIWINFEDGIRTFHLQEDYLLAKWVFFYLGLTKIVDMGTGVNTQIIGSSTFWRYEFTTGLILLALMLPLNFFLTREFSIYGPAISNLISFTVYNAIRYTFLLRKFGMQPFDRKTLYTILLAGSCFCLAFFPFRNYTGLGWMIIRSLAFLVPYAIMTIRLELSPDVLPVWGTVKKRIGLA